MLVPGRRSHGQAYAHVVGINLQEHRSEQQAVAHSFDEKGRASVNLPSTLIDSVSKICKHLGFSKSDSVNTNQCDV